MASDYAVVAVAAQEPTNLSRAMVMIDVWHTMKFFGPSAAHRTPTALTLPHLLKNSLCYAVLSL